MALFRDRATARIAAALALYGLAAVPVAIGLGVFPSLELETRLIPIQKYANTNSNALGFLFYAIGLLGLLRSIDLTRPPSRGALATIFAAILSAAIFYPLAWAPLVAVSLASAAIAARLFGVPQTATRICAAVAAASAIALPYLMSVQIGKSGAATLGLDISAPHLLRNGANLLLVAFGWSALLAFAIPELRRLAREQPAGCVVIASGAVIPGAMFLPSHAAVHSEYKFLALCGFALAIPSALVVKKLYDRSPPLCFALLWMLFFPAGNFFAQLSDYDFRGDSPEVREQGPLILPGDEHERTLANWIRVQTAPDAVFVDTQLSIPPFAHRQIYVAMDPNETTGTGRTGWGLPPLSFLAEVIGHPIEQIEQRRRVTSGLLSPGDSEEPGRALKTLRDDIATSDLYIVARRRADARRLSRRPDLERVFETGPIGVYRVSTGR